MNNLEIENSQNKHNLPVTSTEVGPRDLLSCNNFLKENKTACEKTNNLDFRLGLFSDWV